MAHKEILLDLATKLQALRVEAIFHDDLNIEDGEASAHFISATSFMDVAVNALKLAAIKSK